MPKLYITTDEFEAEELIENSQVNQEPQHEYHEIDMAHGEDLAKELGFNPMTSVEFNGNVSEKRLNKIATKLVKKSLYVATEINGNMKRYLPNDAKEREDMVKLAMQKEYGRRFGVEPAFSLLMYSNNPNEIRDFKF